MSFFHEPPPLDSDIPPPLEDKLKDNDFELEDEEIILEDEELPELPTDFNVFSSACTSENPSYSHPPPFSNFASKQSPPPDDELITETHCDKSDSPLPCDVAKEKESFKIDFVSQYQTAQSAGYDNKGETIPSDSFDEEAFVKNDQVPTVTDDDDDEQIIISTSVLKETDENIPCKEDVKSDDKLPSNDEDKRDETNVEQIITDNKHELKDDFNEFVEADPEEIKMEPFGAFKTEESLASSEFDDFTGLAIQDDIPEPIPELKLDDDEEDDDFNDFETAIPANRQIEQVETFFAVVEESEAPEIKFEADFSGFNAFSESTVETSFDEFQDFKAVSFDNTEKLLEFQPQEDDDDDFGDFNDFTQAPAPVAVQQTELQPVAFNKPANVNGIIDMMFPPTSSSSESQEIHHDGDYAKEHHIIKSDNFVNKFNDFDSTLALGYLYNNSRTSKSLVTALGIDTRNILLGPQWASSSASSNMPRFAANLSFNPIEPLKPSSSSQSSTLKSSTGTKPLAPQPLKAPTDIVPEAEFDWNSSGLVNPLDGPQSKPKQSHDVQSIVIQQQQPPAAASSTHPFENESSLYVMDQEVAQVFEAETKAISGNKSELSEPSAYQWTNESSLQQHFSSSAVSSNIVVRERTIKLPETHIFTPVKGSGSPVAREVVSREVSPAPDDPYFPKGPITVKEYHDVEYSLEPKKRNDSDADFDDFQSAPAAIVKVDPSLVSVSLLEPQKIEKSLTEIKWPEPGNVAQSSSTELDFIDTKVPQAPVVSAAPEAPVVSAVSQAPVASAAPQASVVSAAPTLSFNLPLAPQAPTVNVKKKDQGFSKPVIGTSPTEQNGGTEDDDFNDFQAAPVRSQPVMKIYSNDPITLSPARLVASVGKQSTQKSSWISSMDNDEVNRIEAAFPKCKTEKKPANDDDDDWSDFVGAGASAQPTFAQSQASSMISMSNSSRFSNGEADDWSDFVSVPPPVKFPSAKSSGALSSQFQSKPNFSSWNQPIGKPYVNHSTSFLTKDSGVQNQPFTSSNYPYVTEKVPRQSITITNNFNYSFNHPELRHATGTSGSHYQQKPNGISTILPELDFAMPKNLMSLPRGGQIDPGKK